MPRSCAASSASAICRAIARAVVERQRAVQQPIRERRPFDELQHQRARVPADVGRSVVNAVDRADVLVIQRGEQLRFALESRQAIGVAREGLGQTLIATSRPSVVSRARYTSPMPPDPRRPVISNVPIRVPGVSAI